MVTSHSMKYEVAVLCRLTELPPSSVRRWALRGSFARVLKGLKPSRGDVTGGMGGKALEALWLAKHGCESYVFNLTKSGNLRSLLRGSSSIGTRFVTWKK